LGDHLIADRVHESEKRIDPETGEIIQKRAEPDAALHFEGDGEAAWGTKFVLVAARGDGRGTRVLLDIQPVARPGAEAAEAVQLRCLHE
jgi:predicted aconitase with swiveling domain